ncbi:MAG TPA: FAD-dependent oxidoreductase [Bacteroidia bacterium]|mgnify:CR=1 FL=1|nr:FAD-dependent oxidoreductase [Bacteroidia bacterium]
MNVLIVGQGYAGSMLAWFLLKNGVDVTVADRNDLDGSTRVSAGIMLPITGRRLAKTQNADKIIPYAKNFYREIESATGVTFFTEKDVLQIFNSISNKNEWYSRSADHGMENYIGEILSKEKIHTSIINEYGAITLKQSGFVRPALFLDTMQNFIVGRGKLIQCDFSSESLTLNGSSVSWRNEEYDFVVFCEGHHARTKELFEYLPFNPAKGEILDFETHDLPEDYILVNGAYIVPLGNHKFRTGATYEWKELDTQPTSEGKNILETNLKSVINCEYSITGHKAGIRPSIKDRRPLLGFHPLHERIAIFNGLGTKGAMQGPYYANQMAELIVNGKNPDDDVNITRFNSLFPKQ